MEVPDSQHSDLIMSYINRYEVKLDPLDTCYCPYRYASAGRAMWRVWRVWLLVDMTIIWWGNRNPGNAQKIPGFPGFPAFQTMSSTPTEPIDS